MSELNDYTYGEAKQVSDRLMSEPDVTHSDLIGALANAMNRIHDLETELANMMDCAPPAAPDKIGGGK